MNACNTLGEHTIGIFKTSLGVGPEITYNIIAIDINKIILIGHDGTLADVNTFSKLEKDIRILNYGKINGNFPLKGDSE